MSEHADSLETALWVAFRTLEESASLNRRLAERATEHNHLLSASKFMESAVEIEQHAELLRRVLTVHSAIDEESAG